MLYQNICGLFGGVLLSQLYQVKTLKEAAGDPARLQSTIACDDICSVQQKQTSEAFKSPGYFPPSFKQVSTGIFKAL